MNASHFETGHAAPTCKGVSDFWELLACLVGLGLGVCGGSVSWAEQVAVFCFSRMVERRNRFLDRCDFEDDCRGPGLSSALCLHGDHGVMFADFELEFL